MENSLAETGRAVKLKKFILNDAVYLLMIAVIAVYASLTPLFLSANNIKSLLTNCSPLLVASIGMTFVLLIAEIDLSVGSVAAVSGAVWIMCMTKQGLGLNPIYATIIALCVGAALGACNALLIVVFKINSFLATLGMQIFLRGFVYLITGGSQVLLPKAVKSVTGIKVAGGVSILVIVSLILLVAMSLVYRRTGFGRKVQAVGCNRAAAVKVGIKVNKVRFLVFVLCGLFAAIAGIFQVANVGIIRPDNVGDGLEFLAITAVVLGGTSLMGGSGSFLPGTLVGVIFLMCIENGLGLLGANPYLYPIVRGVVIYLAMFSDSLKRSMVGRR